jgi:hypothetical protein
LIKKTSASCNKMLNAPAGGRQAQPGVATGPNNLPERLGDAKVI